jgi:hypothetical protein
MLHWHPFAPATPFRVGGTPSLETCRSLLPGGCQRSPKEWINHKVLVTLQHNVEISIENIFYNVNVFIALNVDDRSVLNSSAVTALNHRFNQLVMALIFMKILYGFLKTL